MKLYVSLLVLTLAGIGITLSSAKAVVDEYWFFKTSTGPGGHQDDDKGHALDLLRRLTREAAANGKTEDGKGGKRICKYRKGQWSACNPQTKQRVRTFTLKKGDINLCEPTKTLSKKCKGRKSQKG